MHSVAIQQGEQGMRRSMLEYAKMPMTTRRNEGHITYAPVWILVLIVIFMACYSMHCVVFVMSDNKHQLVS